MKLADIRKEIIDHSSNTWAKKIGYKPVYSVSKNSKIVIVGQAPGKKAQESHIPWNDSSGDTLRLWLGISKEDFYDTSKIALLPMDFYFPGKGKTGDLPPRRDFAKLWHQKILDQVPGIKLTILIGQYAQKYYLGEKVKKNLTETVRAHKEYLPRYFPIVHPSPLTIRWRSKNKWFEKETIPFLRKKIHTILK